MGHRTALTINMNWEQARGARGDIEEIREFLCSYYRPFYKEAFEKENIIANVPWEYVFWAYINHAETDKLGNIAIALREKFNCDVFILANDECGLVLTEKALLKEVDRRCQYWDHLIK
jgi:hypothetical protein